MEKQRSRSAGRRPTISREDVVMAALKVLKHEGAGQLSMRAIAAELNVSPMAAYHHVPNKSALVDLVVDEIYRPLTVADVEGEPEERLRLLFRRARDRLREYSGMGLLSHLVHRGDEARRVREEYVTIAREAGFYHSERYSDAFTLGIGLLLTGSSTADSMLSAEARAGFDRRLEDSFMLLLTGLRFAEEEPSSSTDPGAPG